jgi:hypothetical protein
LKKIEEKIKEIEKNNPNNLNIFEDLKFQILSIKKILKNKKAKKIEKIIIEKETDPFKILMM